MILGENDAVAESAALAWSSQADVRLLRPRDLSCKGWVFDPWAPESTRLIVSGESIHVQELRAVYTRLPAVRERDILHIRAQDRSYVAEEMHAFLAAWLSTLPCKVVNRPTPACIAGPAWPWERWVIAASRVGLPTFDRGRATGCLGYEFISSMETSLLHVLGNHIVGEPGLIAQRLLSMVQMADAVAISALVSAPNKSGISSLLDCSPWLDLGDPAVCKALVDLLLVCDQ
jgi:hypothetical protein